MSTEITSSNPFYLQSAYSYGFASPDSNNFELANGIGISSGGMISDGPNVSWEYEEGYWNNGNLVVYIPFQVAGIDAQQYYNSASYADTIDGLSYYNESYINLTTQNNVSVTVSGLPDSTIQFDDQFNGGLNISSDTFDFGTQFQDQSAAANQSVVTIITNLLGLAPDIGTVLDVGKALNDAEKGSGLYGQNVSLSLNGPPIGKGKTLTGNGCLEETYGVDEGNYTGEIVQSWSQGDDWEYWLVEYGNNSFALRQMLELTISESNFDSPGVITLHAANNVSSIYQNNDPKGSQSTHPSAYTSLSIHAMPAYTIYGTAENNNQLLKNQYIEFYDTNGTAYYVKTNDTGAYRFFVNPAHSYRVYLPDEFPAPEYSGVTISPGNSTGGTVQNLNFYESTVQGYVHRANGSPLYGNGWTVTLAINGQSESVQAAEAGYYQAYVDSAGTYTINASGNGGIAQSSSATVEQPASHTYWGNITVTESAIDGRIMQEPINAPLNGGEVIVTLNSYRNVVYADGEGYFQAFLPNTGDYELEALDYYGNVYSSVDVTAADYATYWDNITVYNSQGGCPSKYG